MNVRTSQDLNQQAQAEIQLQGGLVVSESEHFLALMAQVAKTQQLDRQDIRDGRISGQALSWFDRAYVQGLTLTIPDYR